MSANFYTMDIDQALSELNTDVVIGLTSEQASERAKDYGLNRLLRSSRKPSVINIIRQFKDVLVIVLIVAVVVSVIFGYGEGFGRFSEAIIIFAILMVYMAIGVSRKSNADNALREINELASPKVKVKRDGQIMKIDTPDVVPGDIVMLDCGDCIPADLRLIETVNMRVDESSVIGEYTVVRKQANAIIPEGASLSDRKNLAYMGSTVIYGRGAGVVFATGIDSEAARGGAVAETENDENTPLRDKLDNMGKSLGILCIAACAAVFLIGLLYNFLGFGNYREIDNMFLVSASLAVAAVPSGLAIAATVILAPSAKRMVRSKVLVKKLRAVEALGSTTIICSNKTGTLTQNMMTVVQVADFENLYEVTGVGYKAKGLVVSDGIMSRNIALIAEIAVLCNDATFDKRNSQVRGDPTEGALLVFGAKLGLEKMALNAANQRIHEIPFDAARKMMSTYNMQAGKVIMNTKGAPEAIINRSSGVYLDGEIVPMSESIKRRLLARNEEFASKSMRVLACAYKEYSSPEAIDNVEDDLIYVGMMCLIDPLREEAKESIEKCQAAGINVKMITGDHKLTAAAAARQLGIIGSGGEVLDGSEIDALSDDALTERVEYVNVFARVSPEHRVRIITAIKRRKNVVAMTGEGVHDVPSMKMSDVGIAMGLTGTDTAKEAAEMILTDDSFESIAFAIEQGRTIYDNIRKVIGYILGCNLSLILINLVLVILGFPSPLSATQILFIGLLAVTFPAISLGALKKEPGVMNRKPRDPQEPMFSKHTFSSVISRAMFLFGGAIAAYLYGVVVADNSDSGQQTLAMSMCFFTLVIGVVLIAYPSKSEGSTPSGRVLFNSRLLNVSLLFLIAILAVILYVPFISIMFSVTALSIGEVILCLVIAFITTAGYELSKRSSQG
ncbi:MAG: cation-translocating P-type ATPase [Oscillospiraceae bacterium]|nr:cation-translocating P-type ATPase [Oscillospiraceae bacterium]MCL2277997.1 cation-translocating P-type ATPase [Oscillospiraceae bacterium]